MFKTVILFAALYGFLVSAPDVKKVENFSLKDYNGKQYTLTDYKKAKAVVLIFISTECPVSNAYNKRMAEIYKAYKDKDIVFLGINSNKAENNETIKEHAEKNGLDFPILKDPENKIADKLGASVTPEAFVINGNLELLYHGRIDDSRNDANVESKDLSKALDEVLAGKQVSNTNTKAFGCTIKRV